MSPVQNVTIQKTGNAPITHMVLTVGCVATLLLTLMGNFLCQLLSAKFMDSTAIITQPTISPPIVLKQYTSLSQNF